MRGLMSLFTASALLAFGVSDASAFSCKRLFANKSQCAWKVAAKSQHGNVYFTDQPNDRILKWSVDGKLSTFVQPAA